MDWNKINGLIPEVVNDVKKEYIVNNKIIKDDIFRILEKHCCYRSPILSSKSERILSK